MARVTAVWLRDRARGALLAAGGRGFVRFPESGALLVSDAIRRCQDNAAKESLARALEDAGFACCEQDGLLQITPADALLAQIAYEERFAVNWESRLCGAQALAARWLQRQRQPFTPAGRRLIIDTLRLTWNGRVEDGLEAIRSQAAVMQRGGDTSGFYQAGAVLAHWCDEQGGKRHED